MPKKIGLSDRTRTSSVPSGWRSRNTVNVTSFPRIVAWSVSASASNARSSYACARSEATRPLSSAIIAASRLDTSLLSPPFGGKAAVEFRRRNSAGKTGKRPSLGNLLRRFEETGPRCARQGAANTDPPNTGSRQLRHGGKITADEHVDGLRSDGVDDRSDVGPGSNTWRVEALGAGFRVSREPSDCFREIRPSGDESLGTPGQKNTGPAVIDRAPSGPNALYRERELEERVRRVARGVFDRQSSDSRRGGSGDVGAHCIGIGRETTFEVRVDGHLDAMRNRSKVGEGVLERHAVITLSQGPRESGARRRERRKAELSQDTRAAEIPWIGHHEATGLVKLPKCAAAIHGASHRAGYSSRRSTHQCPSPAWLDVPVQRPGSPATRSSTDR